MGEGKDRADAVAGQMLTEVIDEFADKGHDSQIGILLCAKLVKDPHNDTLPALGDRCNQNGSRVYTLRRVGGNKDISCAHLAGNAAGSRRCYFMIDLDSIYPDRVEIVNHTI